MSGLTDIEKHFVKETTKKLYNHPLCNIFRQPVRPEIDGAIDYLDIVKNPMDLGSIIEKIDQNKYTSTKEWADHLFLVWDNAKLYNNDKKSIIYIIADKMSKKSQKMLSLIPKNEYEKWILDMVENQKKIIKTTKKPIDDSIFPYKAY